MVKTQKLNYTLTMKLGAVIEFDLISSIYQISLHTVLHDRNYLVDLNGGKFSGCAHC